MSDACAAAAMVEHGATRGPTLSTYEAMEDIGAASGLPLANREKNKKVLACGLQSLEIARDAGVTTGFGTDLIGESQNRQRREFAIRAEVETPADILRAMYRENPRLCRLEGRIGTLSVGAIADRSEEHTSALQSLMRTSYAVICLKKKK